MKFFHLIEKKTWGQTMKVFFSFFILLSIPTFLSAASFNCAKAASKNEKAICSDPELSNLDMVLAAIYKETRSTISDAKRLKKEQINWIKSLGTCDGNVDCLISAYKNRMLVLDYLDGQITVLIDPLQERIAQLNEREEILVQRENAFTTELRALNSEIERFEEEKLAYNRTKNVPENAEQSSQVIQKPNTSTSSAGASCFDYNSLTDSQSFASGFSAAACSGYFAATQENSNPQMFSQLQTVGANISDVFEEMHCPKRLVSVGGTGNVQTKFQVGYDTALANAKMVQNGAMAASEFQMRVGVCSQVVTHYLKQM